MDYNVSNPFDWGEYEPINVLKEDAENYTYNTTATVRNASYSEVSEETFTDTGFDSYMYNVEAPTPQIKRICGIECPK